MERDRRIELTTQLLIGFGWSEKSARARAIESVAEGEPVLETYSFHALAESLLAPIHDCSWITARDADEADAEADDEPLVRLLRAGASPEDLARFARVMQRQYLSNLACVLDGSGIYGTPNVAFEDFRVFAVDDDSNPQARLEDLHEELGFQDWEAEMEASRRYAETPEE